MDTLNMLYFSTKIFKILVVSGVLIIFVEMIVAKVKQNSWEKNDEKQLAEKGIYYEDYNPAKKKVAFALYPLEKKEENPHFKVGFFNVKKNKDHYEIYKLDRG